MSDMEKAALRGEPSYVWRAGQQRRFDMITRVAEGREQGVILENGCGVGMYVKRFLDHSPNVFGLEYDHDRAKEASAISDHIINAAGEHLPYPANSFDLILSHEVLEHVQDDALSAAEIARVLKPGGRAVIFVPNLGYPFETHGVYLNGKYYFGNKPFVNYLPRAWRDKLAPHVNVYTKKQIRALFDGAPVKIIEHKVIFGAYDNIIAKFGPLGKLLRASLQAMENTPLSWFGLSHFLVIEKNA